MDEVIFIDANIFLEIALNDIKSEECKNLIKDIMLGNKKGLTSDFIIYSCLLQINYKTKETKNMRNFMNSISNINNLEILHASFSEIIKATQIMEDYKLDFDDALVVSIMISNSVKNLASLDKDFDKVDLVKKIIF